MQSYKPGEQAPQAGAYKIISSSGNEIRAGVSMDEGETFPPTPGANQKYVKQ
jgi:hypothetical protein